jgi:hypothetical protein
VSGEHERRTDGCDASRLVAGCHGLHGEDELAWRDGWRWRLSFAESGVW